MKQKYWVLGPEINGIPQVVEVDMEEWAKWFSFKRENRRLALDDVPGKYIEKRYTNLSAEEVEVEEQPPVPAYVSTVFLGIDHNFLKEGPPLIFETMVFGGPLDGAIKRYATWGQAVEGHKRMVEKCHERWSNLTEGEDGEI